MQKKLYLFFFIVFSLISLSSNAQQPASDKQAIANLSLEDRNKLDYYFYEAVNAKAQGKYSKAYDFFQYCLDMDSTNANVLYELGNFHNSLDKKNKAMDLYRQAANYEKDNYYYNMAYATICLEFKQYEDAIELYERLVKNYPDKTDLYVYLSESYRLNGQNEDAIKALDQLEQYIGLNEKISIQKFQLYSLINQQKKAFAEIQKYIDKYPQEVKYQVLLGNLYLQAEKPSEALKVYNKAKTIEPDNPYLISSIAEYYEFVGDKESAERELKTALVNQKMQIETKLEILAQYVTTLQMNKKETETVNALFDTLMIQHPQESQLNLMYGNLLMIQEKKEEARFQYQVFAESNPTNPAGWEQMLSTTFPDSLDLTIRICDEALSYITDQPQFYFFSGLSKYMKKNNQGALADLLKGVQYVDPENRRLLSDFYGQIGDLYFHMEQQDSAFIYYENSIKSNPNNIGILNNYSYFLSLTGKDLDKAEKMSSITINAEPSNPTYLDTYGWILFEQGAYTMAKIYIEKAVNYMEEDKTGDGPSWEVLEHYGDVLYKTGEEGKALEYWIKAKTKETEDDKSKTLDTKIELKKYIKEDESN